MSQTYRLSTETLGPPRSRKRNEWHKVCYCTAPQTALAIRHRKRHYRDWGRMDSNQSRGANVMRRWTLSLTCSLAALCAGCRDAPETKGPSEGPTATVAIDEKRQTDGQSAERHLDALIADSDPL